MTERPILFSADMVNAILRGEKTVTRRPVKEPYELHRNGYLTHPKGNDRFHPYSCPYGRKGDGLWVRETWGVDPDYNTTVYFRGKELDGIKKRPSILMPRRFADIMLIINENVRLEMLHEITEGEAMREGFKVENGKSARENFMTTWKAIYGNTVNRLVWRIAFKKVW